MRKRIVFEISIIIICILLIIISFIADKIVFFDGKLSPVDYSYVRTNKQKPKNAKTSFWFDYGEERILMYGADDYIINSRTKIFSKEAGLISGYNNLQFMLNDKTIGYLIAVVPMQRIDINNDGKRENVFDYARTEFGRYPYLGGPPELFNIKDIRFEILFSEGKFIEVYFNNKLVTDDTIMIVSSDGKESEHYIDENGKIDNLSIPTIRNGFTAIYKDDYNNYYRMYYILEGYKYFSKHTLIGYIPLFKTIIYSIILIIIFGLIRRIYNKNNSQYKIYARKGSKNIKKMIPMSKFEKVRYIILTLSFILWIFLGRWTGSGQLFNQFTIPVFTCPFNYDQVIQSSCFYLSHLTHLIEEGWKFYIPFLLTFFLSIVFLGRIICGFLCPLGFLQEILDKIRIKLHIKPIIVTEKMNKTIQLIKWVMIILFLSLIFMGGDFCDICPNKTFAPILAGYRIDLYIGGLITIIVIAGSFYIRRFWCLVCPLGYIIGIFHKFNIFKLKKDCTACTECGACYEECPMRIKKIYTERKKEDVQETDCIMCGKCIDKCPEDKALCMKLLNNPLYAASRKRFVSNVKKIKDKEL